MFFKLSEKIKIFLKKANYDFLSKKEGIFPNYDFLSYSKSHSSGGVFLMRL